MFFLVGLSPQHATPAHIVETFNDHSFAEEQNGVPANCCISVLGKVFEKINHKEIGEFISRYNINNQTRHIYKGTAVFKEIYKFYGIV